MKKILTLAICLVALFSFDAEGAGRIDDPEYLKTYIPLFRDSIDKITGTEYSWGGTESYADGGRSGRTAALFGSGTYVSLGNIANYDTITVSLNVKYTAINGTWHPLLVKGEKNWGVKIATVNRVGWVIYDTGGNTQYSPVNTVYPNKWYNITCVYDGDSGDMSIYVDGELVQYDEDNASYLNHDAVEARVGGNAEQTSRYLDCQITDVRIYNVALDASEIKELYKLQLAKYSAIQEPRDTLPDVTDSTLEGAWLNRAVSRSADDYSNNHFSADVEAGEDIEWESVGGTFDGAGATGSAFIECSQSVVTGYPFTLYAWVKTSVDDTEMSILQLQDTSSGTDMYNIMFTNTGRIQTRSRNGDFDDNQSDNVLADGAWHQVAGVFNNVNDVKLYIDGALEKETTDGYTAEGIDEVSVGRAGDATPNQYYNGQIKDVRLYSEAKSAEWVAEEYSKCVLDDSLVFMMDDKGNDISKYRLERSTTNNPTYGQFFIDNEKDNEEYISYTTTNDSYLDFGTGAFTVTFWTAIESYGNIDTMISKYQGSDHGWYIGLDDTSPYNTIYFKYGDGSNDSGLNDGTITIPLNQWVKVTAVHLDNGYDYVYVNDAVSEEKVSLTNVDMEPTQSLHIGCNLASSLWYDGKIADVRIYNEAKDADWVEADYNRTKKYY